MATKRSRRAYPGSIVRRGKTFRVMFHFPGKHREEFTLRTTDRREVVEFAKVKYAELDRVWGKRRHAPGGPQKLSQLFDRYDAEVIPLKAPNTQRTYRQSLKIFRRFFLEVEADRYLYEMQPEDVQRFMAWRLQGGTGRRPSLRTAEKERTVLHGTFAFAVRLRMMGENPTLGVERPKPDTRQPVILTDAQYDTLLRCCEGRPMLALYVLTLGETGGRCESEILRLRWEDLDMDDGFIQVVSGRDGHRTKGGKSRWVPITPRLANALRTHALRYRGALYLAPNGTEAPSPWVFHHLTTRRRALAGERLGCLRAAFLNAAERAALPSGLHQHDLRHRRVTTWLAEGRDVVLVKEAVGHADLRTTMGYTHLAKEHLRALIGLESATTRAIKAG
jgi:site-specific recombinase XerD